MRFILVECRGAEPIGPFKEYRATCVLPEKTVDVFFWERSLEAAERHVVLRYPEATFSHKGGQNAVRHEA